MIRNPMQGTILGSVRIPKKHMNKNQDRDVPYKPPTHRPHSSFFFGGYLIEF